MLIEAARARVEADGERRAQVGGLGLGAVDQPLEQPDREVVDRFPAEILEHAQRRGLARAEQPGNEQDALPGGFDRGAFAKCLPAQVRNFQRTVVTPDQTIQQIVKEKPQLEFLSMLTPILASSEACAK